MGKKYIVEIGRLERLYKAYVENGKPSMTWLSPEVDLKPYTEPDLEQVRKEAYEEGFNVGRTLNTGKYEKGLNDAWEAARKIWKYDTTTLRAIFGEGIMRMDWFMKFTASEAIEKIRQYEQEQEEIQVGDEVMLDNTGRKYVVLVVDDENKPVKLLENDGYTLTVENAYLTKTGRHFPEIAAVLAKMKEGS